MYFEKIEITSGRHGFFAQVDGVFATNLSPDEVLGVVASAMFGTRPIFLRDYEDWVKIRRRFFSYEQPVEPVALLEHRPQQELRGVFSEVLIQFRSATRRERRPILLRALGSVLEDLMLEAAVMDMRPLTMPARFLSPL